MKKVNLDSGITLGVKDDVMDNMELLDDMVELDEGNGFAISRVLNRVLEPDEKKKLYDHLRENGVTKVSKVVDAMKDIFDKLGDNGKN